MIIYRIEVASSDRSATYLYSDFKAAREDFDKLRTCWSFAELQELSPVCGQFLVNKRIITFKSFNLYGLN